MQGSLYTTCLLFSAFVLIAGGCVELPAEGEFRTLEVQTVFEFGPDEPIRLLPLDLPRGRDTLRFGIIPALGPAVAIRSTEPLVAYLEEVLKVPIEVVLASTYDQLVTYLADDKVELALLTPLSYVKATEKMEDLIAVAGKIGRGTSHYSSYILVRAEDSIQGLDDLKGKRMAFVDPSSSSGFLLPYDYMMRHGIDPEEDLQSMVFAGSHSEALKMLALGQVDVAASGSGVRKMLQEELRAVDGAGDTRFRIIANAGPIPYGGICTRETFPESGVRKVRRALLQLNTLSPQGRALWRASGDITGWMLPNDVVYSGLRRQLNRVREWRSESTGLGTLR